MTDALRKAKAAEKWAHKQVVIATAGLRLRDRWFAIGNASREDVDLWRSRWERSLNAYARTVRLTERAKEGR